MRLLLDEMYSTTVAEQLCACGHDVVSVHEAAYRRLEGAPDTEIAAAATAEQLRARGHDVVSVHEAAYRRLEGAPDTEIAAAATAEDRALVTENVADFQRLESDALARGRAFPALVFTTNRQFPRGQPATTGLLVRSLDDLLSTTATVPGALFLRPVAGDEGS